MKFSRLILSLTAACGCATTLAIELQSAIRLPDKGFGASARASCSQRGGYLAVGSVNDSLGRPLPALYDWLETQPPALTELLIPSGGQGVALGVKRFSDGDVCVVGNASSGPGGDMVPVLWWKPEGGQWSSPTLLLPAVQQARVLSSQGSGTDEQIVLCSGVLGGARRPLLIIIDLNGGMDTALLPVPPGGHGEALTATGNSGPTDAAGWIQMNGGHIRPARWELQNGQWRLFPVNAPPNVNASVTDLIIDPFTAFCGTAFRNGRSFGIYSANPGGGLLGLKPLAGYESSASDAIWQGPLDEDGPAFIVGRSFAPGTTGDAQGWIVFGEEIETFAIESLLSDPEGDLIDVTFFAPGDAGSSVGDGLDEQGIPSAALFLCNHTLVPDGFLVSMGQGTAPLSSLWHEDDSELQVRTKRVGNGRRAVLDLILTPLSFSAGQDARMDSQFRVPGNQVSGGVINVYLRNMMTKQYDQVISQEVSGGEVDMDLPISAYGPQHHDPTTGSVYMRIEFLQNGNRPGEFGIDMTRLIIE